MGSSKALLKESNVSHLSRRSFITKSTTAGVAASAFTIIQPELVRGAGKEKLKAGLIGCGGRGTEAVTNLLTGTQNVELVAMGDLFEDRLEKSLKTLHNTEKYAQLQDRIKVAPDARFVGFDAFKKVIASDIDIVMLATPPGYRPMHFEAAIDARKHVFCEKPFGTDPVGVRRFMAAAKKSEELKLTVVSGAQRRFARDYRETIDKIHDGAIGDVVATYANWVGGPVIFFPKGRDPKWGDMTYEHRQWYSFVWIGGDQVVEQHLHNIDVCNWVMGTHPEKVLASGGAAWRPRDDVHGNIYDHLTSDFVYANGVHMSSHCRQYPKGSKNIINELIIGTKGRSDGHDLGSSGRHTGVKDPLENPYVREHMALVASIRGDGPYINHGMTVAESTLTCIMAREAAYSGLEITWDMIMNSQQDLSPKEFGYDVKMEAPPLPVPGQYKFI
jgi:predicted dehydrogenase